MVTRASHGAGPGSKACLPSSRVAAPSLRLRATASDTVNRKNTVTKSSPSLPSRCLGVENPDSSAGAPQTARRTPATSSASKNDGFGETPVALASSSSHVHVFMERSDQVLAPLRLAMGDNEFVENFLKPLNEPFDGVIGTEASRRDATVSALYGCTSQWTFGTKGIPGLFPLALQFCALRTSLHGFSIVACSSVDGTRCTDLLRGQENIYWEDANVEPFVDAEKVMALVLQIDVKVTDFIIRVGAIGSTWGNSLLFIGPNCPFVPPANHNGVIRSPNDEVPTPLPQAPTIQALKFPPIRLNDAEARVRDEIRKLEEMVPSLQTNKTLHSPTSDAEQYNAKLADFSVGEVAYRLRPSALLLYHLLQGKPAHIEDEVCAASWARLGVQAWQRQCQAVLMNNRVAAMSHLMTQEKVRRKLADETARHKEEIQLLRGEVRRLRQRVKWQPATPVAASTSSTIAENKKTSAEYRATKGGGCRERNDDDCADERKATNEQKQVEKGEDSASYSAQYRSKFDRLRSSTTARKGASAPTFAGSYSSRSSAHRGRTCGESLGSRGAGEGNNSVDRLVRGRSSSGRSDLSDAEVRALRREKASWQLRAEKAESKVAQLRDYWEQASSDCPVELFTDCDANAGSSRYPTWRPRSDERTSATTCRVSKDRCRSARPNHPKNSPVELSSNGCGAITSPSQHTTVTSVFTPANHLK